MSERAQFVTIGVAGEIFAAPITRIREILDMRPIARIPWAPPQLLGMIDVRGAGVPVLDLRLMLGLPAEADSESTRIVVLSFDDRGGTRTVGLRADRVFEVTVLDDEALDPPPAASAAGGSGAIAGIGRRNGSFVTVLDMDRLIGSLALPEAAPASA